MLKPLTAVGLVALMLTISGCGKDEKDGSESSTSTTTAVSVPLTYPDGSGPMRVMPSTPLTADDRNSTPIVESRITNDGKQIWVSFQGGGSVECAPAELELKRQSDTEVVATVFVARHHPAPPNPDGSPGACVSAALNWAITGEINPSVNADAKVIDGSKV